MEMHWITKLQSTIHLPNQSVVNGQEALLMVTLFKFAKKATDLYDMEKVFGWQSSRLSRIIKYVTLYIYKHHNHRLHALHFHAPRLALSKKAYREKTKLINNGHHFPLYTRECALSLDGTLNPTCSLVSSLLLLLLFLPI
jgi:hypothetical protein